MSIAQIHPIRMVSDVPRSSYSSFFTSKPDRFVRPLHPPSCLVFLQMLYSRLRLGVNCFGKLFIKKINFWRCRYTSLGLIGLVSLLLVSYSRDDVCRNIGGPLTDEHAPQVSACHTNESNETAESVRRSGRDRFRPERARSDMCDVWPAAGPPTRPVSADRTC